MGDQRNVDLGRELTEFFDSLESARADGKITLDEWPEILKQLCDVLGVVVAGLRQNPEAVESIKTQLVLRANAAIDKFQDGRILKKSAAKAAVMYVVPWLIDGAAASDQPDAWLDAYVLPTLKKIEDGAHAIRVKLGG